MDDDRMAAWRSLQWAVAVIMRRFRGDLGAQGMTTEEFDVLIHLAAADGGEVPLQRLADVMVLGDTLSRSGLTRLLDRMERDGLVLRRLDAEDRRRFDVILTAEGRSRFNAVWPGHVQGIEEYFSALLTDRDIADLQRTLKKLIAANEAAPVGR